MFHCLSYSLTTLDRPGHQQFHWRWWGRSSSTSSGSWGRWWGRQSCCICQCHLPSFQTISLVGTGRVQRLLELGDQKRILKNDWIRHLNLEMCVLNCWQWRYLSEMQDVFSSNFDIIIWSPCTTDWPPPPLSRVPPLRVQVIIQHEWSWTVA